MTGNTLPSLTREFFEQNSRSATLRNLALRALDASEGILASDGQDIDALALALDINQQLEALGIVPEMHVIAGDDPDAEEKRQQMASNPVLAMEWVTGQVRYSLVETSAFTNSRPLITIAEHDELEGQGGSTSLINPRTIGSKARQFMVDLQLIGTLRDFIDYEAGSSQLS